MLESVEDSQKWGRYSFLGFDPLLEFTCQNGCVQIKGDSKFEDSSKLTDDDKVIIETNNPGEVIKDLVRQNKSPKLTNLPPFTGGFVGYFAYDYIKTAGGLCQGMTAISYPTLFVARNNCQNL